MSCIPVFSPAAPGLSGTGVIAIIAVVVALVAIVAFLCFSHRVIKSVGGSIAVICLVALAVLWISASYGAENPNIAVAQRAGISGAYVDGDTVGGFKDGEAFYGTVSHLGGGQNIVVPAGADCGVSGP